MSERRSVAKVVAARYRKASKKQKGGILDELIALTGYNRWYAVGLLRGHGKTIKSLAESRGDSICSKRPDPSPYTGLQ